MQDESLNEAANSTANVPADLLTGAEAASLRDLNEGPSISHDESFVSVPLDLIDAENQQRQTSGLDDSLDELAASIKRHGLLQPIVIRPSQRDPGRYVIVAGHRRTFAANLAGLDHIPARIIRPQSQIEHDEAQLVENLQRENLNLEETAAALASLFDHHKNLLTVAKAVGKSKSWVSKHMAPAMPNFGTLARRLLSDDVSNDIEFLTIISSIEKNEPTPEELKTIEDGIRAGTFGRKEARRALAKMKTQTPNDDDGSGETGESPTPTKKLPAFIVAHMKYSAKDDTHTLDLQTFPDRARADEFAATLTASYSITAVQIDNPACI